MLGAATKLLPIQKRDFVSLSGFTASGLYELFEFGSFIKAHRKERNVAAPYEPLKHRTIAMIFEKPSLRTRVSFELGVHELGGYAAQLTGETVGLGKREAVKDVAELLSRYNDAIVARLYSHSIMEELAAYASVPVINALTDLSHPCQILADAFTLYEKGLWHDGIKVVFVGDGNNVANSWIELAGILPMHFVLACPEGYEPDAEILSKAKQAGVSKIEICYDAAEAVKHADVIYTDVWTSMGQETETKKRLQDFSAFQVNGELVSKAKSSAVVMHCLPAHRGEEITDDVLSSEQSLVMDEAENRLHIQKALMVKLLSPAAYQDYGLSQRLKFAAEKYERERGPEPREKKVASNLYR
ncbi:MAG: ornithine carbamoyltransferase [Rhizobacter sp.]|nr:ornithine carbamoyltransferase [Chlorobiales bacterium]